MNKKYRYGFFTIFLLLTTFLFCEENQTINIKREPSLIKKEAIDFRNLIVDEIDSVYTPENLVTSFIGNGIIPSNVQYVGSQNSSGFFYNGASVGLDIDEGIILSSGSAKNLLGPNEVADISGYVNTPGDPDLDDLILGYFTQDATVLEFDFIPNFNGVSFSYIFASEEYLEYVNSAYNDVFGFFLNGVNVAIVPNSLDPVSINNVNHLQNTEFFINNDIHDGPDMGYPPSITYDIEADGLTTRLTIHAFVNENEINHIKLAIADAGDAILDSWVMLEANSFSSIDFEEIMQVDVTGGNLYEIDEDTYQDIEFVVRGLNNAQYDWVLSNPVWGNVEFVDQDRFTMERRIVRYTPYENYNGGYFNQGVDDFVVAVFDNLGSSIYTVIGISTVPINDPPQNLEPPSISGDFIVNNEIICDKGIWSDDIDNQYVPPNEDQSVITIFYQWQCSENNEEWIDIEDAINENYILTPEDEDLFIRCLVTAVDDGVGFGDNDTTVLPTSSEICLPLSASTDMQISESYLVGAVPNPFSINSSRNSTSINFYLKETSDVKIVILNVKGERINTIKAYNLPAGNNSLDWNGKDYQNRNCSSGLYFYKFVSKNFVDFNKILILN